MGTSKVIVNANLISGYASLHDCGIYVRGNVVEDVFSMKRFASKGFSPDTEIIDAKGNLVCAGLIDTHIHGIGGFGTECMTQEAILEMSKTLALFGVTSFIPTLYPDEKEKLFKMEDAIVNAMGHEKGARILGINVEGPFISPLRSGALPKNSMSQVDIDYFDRIIDHGKGHVICMTVAPELKHMHELALHAKSRGIVLLAGHTDATYENMTEAMQCGIFHSTHFFNAMSPLHHRNPGAVGAVLINPGMCCEIIADGVHVHPELVKMVVKQKPAENIVLVTDSLTPNKQKQGPLFANGVEVVLSEDGAFVSKDNENLLNGSALTLNKALANMRNWGIMPELSVRMATENPARIYNLEKLGTVIPGSLADIVIFDSDFNPLTVMINGIIQD